MDEQEHERNVEHKYKRFQNRKKNITYSIKLCIFLHKYVRIYVLYVRVCAVQRVAVHCIHTSLYIYTSEKFSIKTKPLAPHTFGSILFYSLPEPVYLCITVVVI